MSVERERETDQQTERQTHGKTDGHKDLKLDVIIHFGIIVNKKIMISEVEKFMYVN